MAANTSLRFQQFALMAHQNAAPAIQGRLLAQVAPRCPCERLVAASALREAALTALRDLLLRLIPAVLAALAVLHPIVLAVFLA
jgi:hypothetical protein